jgi:aminoglycoside phosphotransferase (APT) family kinase protein
MIPPEKSDAVVRAVREAFGVDRYEEIRELTGPRAANPVFRIVVQGFPYLLRINLRAGDLTRHFTCMRAAAEAGLAPRVWYTSVEDRVSITDFIEAVPLPAEDALLCVPRALRALHALPPFPEAPVHLNTTCTFLLNRGPALDAVTTKIRAANILPRKGAEELFARHEQLVAAYPQDGRDRVSSHNDLFKPDNMLFDGDRFWLVDWEAAFPNDRYADLAVVANLLVSNEAEEQLFLQEYFGAPPNDYQLARFFLMQQLAHMFYAMIFLVLTPGVEPVNWDEPAPGYVDFHRRLWAREINLADSDVKSDFGRLHWERLLDNMGQSRFDEALGIVSVGRVDQR